MQRITETGLQALKQFSQKRDSYRMDTDSAKQWLQSVVHERIICGCHQRRGAPLKFVEHALMLWSKCCNLSELHWINDDSTLQVTQGVVAALKTLSLP